MVPQYVRNLVRLRSIFATTQIFRMKTECSHAARNAPIKPFKIYSVWTIFGSNSNESCCMITHAWPLEAFGLQSVHLSSYTFF